MTSKETIRARIAFLKRQIEILRRFKTITERQYNEQIETRGACERYLYLACQACIDIAQMTVALKELATPQSAAEAFEILHEARILPPALAERLRLMVGFRNILAHGYERVQFSYVKAALTTGVRDLEQFVKVIARIR